MENSAKAKTTDAISRLFELRVEKVNVVEATPEGEVIREKSMDVELAKVGDLIRVRPGEQVKLFEAVILGLYVYKSLNPLLDCS